MISNSMALVTVKVDVKENEPEPEQQLDSGEHIIKRLVPVKGRSRSCLIRQS